MSSLVDKAIRHARFYELLGAYMALSLAREDAVALPGDETAHELKYCEIKFRMVSEPLRYEAIMYAHRFSQGPFNNNEDGLTLARRILPRWAAISIVNHRAYPAQGSTMQNLRKAMACVIAETLNVVYRASTGNRGLFHEVEEIEAEIHQLLTETKGE